MSISPVAIHQTAVRGDAGNNERSARRASSMNSSKDTTKPAQHLEDGIACWSQWLDTAIEPGRPALFLDRDGVLVEEVHFLSKAGDVALCPGIGEAISAANRAGMAVIEITNQSGIARGLFGWEAFGEVEREIQRQLSLSGARLNAVLACGFHEAGAPPYDVADHPWRKPAPGMLLRARDVLGVDLSRSHVIGDRMSDIHAGRNAGLAGGVLVETGYGADQQGKLAESRQTLAEAGFSVHTARDGTDAIRLILGLGPS